jgi:hypothetical protein
MSTLQTIDTLTKKFADANVELRNVAHNLNDAIENIYRQFEPDLRCAISVVADREAALSAAILASPELFFNPRTLVIHGVKVGIVKGKGKLQIENKEQTLRLIKKNFPDLAQVLIITEEKPSKDALASLPASDLKKLGAAIEGCGDVVVINPVDSDVDKLTVRYIKEYKDRAAARAQQKKKKTSTTSQG